MFDRMGRIIYPAAVADAEAMLEAAVEAGAEDVESDADYHVIWCAPGDLSEAAQALETRLGEAESTKLVWRPQNLTPVDGDTAETLMKLISALEDDDDVQSVTANLDVSDEVMERLAS